MANNVETIYITFTEVEPFEVTISGYTVLESIAGTLVQETYPQDGSSLGVLTKLTSRKFETNYMFVSNSLKVFLNGIKEKYINVLSDTEFEFEIDTVPTDTIEVEYIKKDL